MKKIEEMKTLAQVSAICIGAVALIGIGVMAGKTVVKCPEYVVSTSLKAVSIPTTDAGDMSGVKCLTVRGYFAGNKPAAWRLLKIPVNKSPKGREE